MRVFGYYAVRPNKVRISHEESMSLLDVRSSQALVVLLGSWQSGQRSSRESIKNEGYQSRCVVKDLIKRSLGEKKGVFGDF